MAPPNAAVRQTPRTLADAEPEGTPPPVALVPDPPKVEPVKGAAAPAPEVDRLARLEEMFARFAGSAEDRFEQMASHVGKMAHVIDRLASAPPASETAEIDHEDRIRPDDHLADEAADFSVKELYRMLELKGHQDEVARLRAEGIGHDTHWIANDCMAIGVLDASGKEVQTKVMPGEAIPREKLSAETITWAKEHPEGVKLVRPGEYRAPKPTAPHTR